VDIPADPGAIALFVREGASVRLSSTAHLAEVHVTDDGELIAAPAGGVLRASTLSIGPRASLVLGGGPLIIDRGRYAREAQLKQYIYNGQVRDDRSSELTAVLNDDGNRSPRIRTFAGEEVDAWSVLVAGSRGISPPGDYNADGLVSQRDLDLVLAHWGAEAASVPSTWRQALPSGLVDQEELDAVLANWGRTTEFLPF
jgi:hypothetical protein